jgi:ABC-type sugar transport system substrate-binding protein
VEDRKAEIVIGIIGLVLLPVAIWYYAPSAWARFRTLKVKLMFITSILLCIAAATYAIMKVVGISFDVVVSPWEVSAVCLACLAVGLSIVIVKQYSTIKRQRQDNLRSGNELRTLGDKCKGLQEEIAHKSPVAFTDLKVIYVFIPRAEDAHDSFWLAFTKSVHDAVLNRGYSCRVEYLKNDYATYEQILQLKEFVATQWDNASGVIVSLADQSVMPELMDIVKKSSVDGTPIVLHDLAPSAASSYYAPTGIAPNLVCVDNEVGGRLAAKLMLDCLGTKEVPKPFQLVCVQGSSAHPHSALRFNGFEGHLRSVLKPEEYHIWQIEGGWTIDGAESTFCDFMKDKVTPRVAEIHGVFAFNDEMAIGVNKALFKQIRRGNPQPMIVGFDNIEMLQQAWRMNDNCAIVGTVDAELKQQARASVDLVMDLIKTKSSQRNIRIITPSIKMRPIH